MVTDHLKAVNSSTASHCLSHHLRIAMGRNVKNKDLLTERFRLAPLLELLDDLPGILADDGAVARADHVDHIVANLFHSGENLVLEGAEDAIEVEMAGRGKIVNLIIEYLSLGTVMGAEGIAGEEDIFFLQAGKHGVRPVQERSDDKT